MPNNINNNNNKRISRFVTNSFHPGLRPGLRNFSFIFLLTAALFVTGCADPDDNADNPPIPPQVELNTALQQGGPGNLVSLNTTVRCLIDFCRDFIVTFYRSTNNVTVAANDEELGRSFPALFVNGDEIPITFAPPLPVTRNNGYYYYSCIDDACSPVSSLSVNEPFVIFRDNVTTDKNEYTTTEDAVLSVNILCQGAVCPVDRIRRVQFYRTSAPGTTGSTNAGERTAVGPPFDVTSPTNPEGGDTVTVNATDFDIPGVSGTYGYHACYENTNVCSGPSAEITVTAVPAPPGSAAGTLRPDGATTIDISNAQAGQSVPLELTATILCAGGDCAAATAQFYVTYEDTNTQGELTRMSAAIGPAADVGPLTDGGSMMISLNTNTPQEAGTYQYFICILLEANDCLTPPSLPNLSESLMVTIPSVIGMLSVGKVGVNATALNSGDPLQLSVAISCSGGDCAGDTLQFYATQGQLNTFFDNPLGEPVPVPPLNDSGEQTVTPDITTPSEAGTYRYFACITGPEPDLCGMLSDPVVLTDLMPPANPGRLTFVGPNQDKDGIRAGDSLEFMAFLFCEDGPCAQSQVILYRSDDDTINTSDDEEGSTLIPAIEESRHHSTPPIDTTAPLTPGTYHYGLCLPGDDDSCVKIATITVSLPDGVLSFNDERVITNISLAAQGEPLNLSVEILCSANTQDCEMADVSFYVSSTYSDPPLPSNANMKTIGSPVPVAPLAAGASRTISTRINAAATNGNYYYFACIDGTNPPVCTQHDSVPVTVKGLLRHIGTTNSTANTFRFDSALNRLALGENLPNVFRLSGMVGCRGGDCGLSPSSLSFYRSNNETINGSEDPIAGSFFSVSAPNHYDNASYSSEINELPGLAARTYYYGSCFEHLPEDCSVPVQVTKRGNYVLENLEVNSSSPATEEMLNISVDFDCVVSASCFPSIISFYRSDNALISPDDFELGTQERPAGGTPGGEGSYSINITAPNDAGTYYYGACTEADEDQVQNDPVPNESNICTIGLEVRVGGSE